MKNTTGDNTQQEAKGEGHDDKSKAATEEVQLDDDIQIEIERDDGSEQDLKNGIQL